MSTFLVKLGNMHAAYLHDRHDPLNKHRLCVLGQSCEPRHQRQSLDAEVEQVEDWQRDELHARGQSQLLVRYVQVSFACLKDLIAG